jgi:hypothetical protein
MLARSARTSRRAVITGVSAMAAAALAPLGVARAAPSNRGLLDLLHAVEQIEVALLQAILDAFDDASFAAAGFPDGTRDRMQSILEADRTHMKTLERVGEVPTPPTVVMHAASPTEALAQAITMKNLATAAYAGVIPELARKRRLPDLLGIHSVEARQAAYLSVLVGTHPFANAIDDALAPEEVVNRIQAMVRGGSTATPEAASTVPEAIIAAIAKELGVDVDAVQVVSAEPRQWPDTSLGCPKPGKMYAQVITPGYRVAVEVNGARLEFHTDEQGHVVRCP